MAEEAGNVLMLRARCHTKSEMDFTFNILKTLSVWIPDYERPKLVSNQKSVNVGLYGAKEEQYMLVKNSWLDYDSATIGVPLLVAHIYLVLHDLHMCMYMILYGTYTCK